MIESDACENFVECSVSDALLDEIAWLTSNNRIAVGNIKNIKSSQPTPDKDQNGKNGPAAPPAASTESGGKSGEYEEEATTQVLLVPPQSALWAELCKVREVGRGRDSCVASRDSCVASAAREAALEARLRGPLQEGEMLMVWVTE